MGGMRERGGCRGVDRGRRRSFSREVQTAVRVAGVLPERERGQYQGRYEREGRMQGC